MVFIATAWLKAANTDLLAAEHLLTSKNLTSIVIFHCQQSIEKAFKAILAEHGKEPLKIHDLLRLYHIVSGYIDPIDDLSMLKVINEAYIDSRYPGELGLLPSGQPSATEARSCYEFTFWLYNNVAKRLQA